MTDRIRVDREQCDGYGNCVFVAPDVFDLDDANRVILLVDVVEEASREDVVLAIAECPMRAIGIESSTSSLAEAPPT